jgi:hypothetical protein
VSADLEALLTSLYVLVGDLLPPRRRFGRPPRISESELICLAVARVLLDCPNEAQVAALGARLLRPDRKNQQPRFGSLGGIRQWIESTFDTLKDQLSLERHRGRTLTGLVRRVARRLLALTAVLLHNSQTGTPGRRVTAYDH